MKTKGGNLRQFVDPDLMSALAHPLRAYVLGMLSERVASPSDLAREAGVDVTHVAYHVKELHKAGYLELVKTEQHRGAVEHYYRAKAMFLIDNSEWERLPLVLRRGFSTGILQAMLDEAKAAIEAGTFDSRDERHVSWTTLQVDEKGWRDLNAVLDESLERMFEIRTECEERVEGSGEETIPACVTMICFETAGSTSEVAEAPIAQG